MRYARIYFVSKFAEWFKNAYFDWERQHSDGIQGITKFAEYLGVEQPQVSAWMKGKYKPGRENVGRLAAKLGPGVFDALNMPAPDRELARLIQLYESASEEQKEKIIRQALLVLGFVPEE